MAETDDFDILKALVGQWIDSEDEDEIEKVISGSGLEPVSSSNLAAVGYLPKRRELVVAFLDGSVYVYRGVTEDVYEALMHAPSHGTYFYHNIRMVYPFDRYG